MIAFWKYDKFPFLLSGTVVHENPDGTVFIKEYGTTFVPVFLMTNDAGKKMQDKLSDLSALHRQRRQQLDDEFMERLSGLYLSPLS